MVRLSFKQQSIGVDSAKKKSLIKLLNDLCQTGERGGNMLSKNMDEMSPYFHRSWSYMIRLFR
jgi:hypothetical protein